MPKPWFSIFIRIQENEPSCYQAMNRCGHFDHFNLKVTGSIILVTIYLVSDNLHNSKEFSLTWKGISKMEYIYIYMKALVDTRLTLTIRLNIIVSVINRSLQMCRDNIKKCSYICKVIV